MFHRIITLAKPLSTTEIKDKVLHSAAMQGRRVLYEKDFGSQQYGLCFCADGNAKGMGLSYVHIRILDPGEFKYEEMISTHDKKTDALMITLGKEIEA